MRKKKSKIDSSGKLPITETIQEVEDKHTSAKVTPMNRKEDMTPNPMDDGNSVGTMFRKDYSSPLEICDQKLLKFN